MNSWLRAAVAKTLAALTLTILSSQAMAAGALAIDEKQGAKYGWAVDYPTFEQAEKEALKKCGSGCNIVFTFSGGSAAYSADQSKGSTIFGWGRAASADRAKQIALEEARNRGARSPIVRAWGQESKKDKTGNDSKLKVLVQLKLRLENGTNIYAKGGWAQFVGWTYATKDELLQYGTKRQYVTYSDDVTGSNENGNFLLTSDGQAGTPDSSPIMKRFVDAVVHKNSLYNRRKVDEYSEDVMSLYSYNSTFGNSYKYHAYDGKIIILDGNWTYEQLKNSVTFFEKKEGGYSIVDAGEF